MEVRLKTNNAIVWSFRLNSTGANWWKLIEICYRKVLDLGYNCILNWNKRFWIFASRRKSSIKILHNPRILRLHIPLVVVKYAEFKQRDLILSKKNTSTVTIKLNRNKIKSVTILPLSFSKFVSDELLINVLLVSLALFLSRNFWFSKYSNTW